MEENEAADDFYADGYMHEAWREGYDASGVTDVPWHFRIDISDRYGQNWGQLDNRINWWDLGSGAAGWHWPQKKYRQYHIDSDKPEDWMWYGLGSSIRSGGPGQCAGTPAEVVAGLQRRAAVVGLLPDQLEWWKRPVGGSMPAAATTACRAMASTMARS